MSDADTPTTPPSRPAPGVQGAITSTQERADALGTAVRRALWPAFAIVLVITAQAVAEVVAADPGERPQVGFLVIYSLMIWAMLPVVVTVSAAGATALLTKEPLPATALCVLAGVVTLAWVGWIAGGWLGVLFGAVLGAAVTGAALVLVRRWSLAVRLPVAVVVAAVGTLLVLAVGAAAS